MPDKSNLRADLSTFSVSTPELALFCGLFFKEHGYELDGNLMWEVQSRAGTNFFTGAKTFSINVGKRSVSWSSQEREPNHFTTALDFLNWVQDLPILPKLGCYQPKLTPTHLKVGCTDIDWATFDKLVTEVTKYRAKDPATDEPTPPAGYRRVFADEQSTADFTDAIVVWDNTVYKLQCRSGNWAFYRQDGTDSHVSGGFATRGKAIASAFKPLDPTIPLRVYVPIN